MKMVEDRELRGFWEKAEGKVEQMLSRIETLEKVKHLFTIPGTDFMTTRQVAEYYEVDIETVRKVYQRHKAEIDSDGTAVKKAADFLTEPEVQVKDADRPTGREVTLGRGDGNVRAGQPVQSKGCTRGVTSLEFRNGVVIEINNGGTRVFSRRAVLRIGMLMPGSRVATEVRTQLLNVFEKVPGFAAVEDLDKETFLYKRIGEAFTNGNVVEASSYMTQLTEYLSRNNKALREANKNLADDNERLDAENKVLLKEEMEWDTRKLINAVVRRVAGIRFPDGGEWKYGKMWNYWKSLMYNKEGISIGRRQVGCKGSYLDMLRDDEWPAAMSCTLTFAKQYGVDITDLLAHAKEGLLDECKC